MNSRHLNRFVMAICFLSIAALAPSCVTGEAGTKIVSYPYASITENSRLVANRLQITDLRKTTVNDLMKVQITALGVMSRNAQFEYRFRWLDKNGFEIKTPLSTWNTVACHAKDTINIMGIAPSGDATSFDLLIKYPDRW